MKRYLPFALIGAVFLSALGAGLLFFHLKKRRIGAAPKLWLSANRGAEPPHLRGPDSAAVTLEEFGDFQCQPCGDLSPVLEKLGQNYSSQLRVIFRQFPLKVHIRALDATRASEAAGFQGRFWEMHDLLYRNRFIWPRAPNLKQTFQDYAKSLGLDPERFTKKTWTARR